MILVYMWIRLLIGDVASPNSDLLEIFRCDMHKSVKESLVYLNGQFYISIFQMKEYGTV